MTYYLHEEGTPPLKLIGNKSFSLVITISVLTQLFGELPMYMACVSICWASERSCPNLMHGSDDPK